MLNNYYWKYALSHPIWHNSQALRRGSYRAWNWHAVRQVGKIQDRSLRDIVLIEILWAVSMWAFLFLIGAVDWDLEMASISATIDWNIFSLFYISSPGKLPPYHPFLSQNMIYRNDNFFLSLFAFSFFFFFYSMNLLHL